MEEKKFMTIIETVQISYLNTEAMIREDGEIFIKVTRDKYFDKKKFISEAKMFALKTDYIDEIIELFDSISKYAKEKYKL